MDSFRVGQAAGAVLITALAGCAGVEPPAPAGAEDAIVRLQKDSLTLFLDNAERLAVTRTDADGHPAPARLQWRSGDQSVVVVDSLGTVTAVGLGRTWIVVSDTRHTDTAVVNTFIRFYAIDAGEDFTCALALGGQAACWGRNAFGSLGDGGHFDRGEPGLVDGGHRFTDLSVGAGSACGIGGSLYCWGYNGVGQLGDGTIAERPRPVRVADTLALANVTLGAGTTTCALEQGASPETIGPRRAAPLPVLLCWGWNGFGQMLDGGGVNPHRPKVVDTGKDIVAFATGGHHLCVLEASGAAWCWGRNDEGQLGDSSTASRLSPVAVVGGLRYDMLAAGIAHTCGRSTAGQVWCWGSNAKGQLGSGASSAPIPMLAAGGMTFDTVVSSAYHTCGLHAGRAWCWGDNAEHQLGRLDSGNQPAEVAGGLHFTSISAGRNHTCAISTDGVAWCWGGNLHGQLGAESTADRFSPVMVARQQ